MKTRYKIVMILVILTQTQLNASEIDVDSTLSTSKLQETNIASGTVKGATEYIPGFNDVMNDVLWDKKPTNDTEMLELLSQGEDYSNVEIIDYDGYDYNNIQAGRYTITLSDTTETYLDTPVDFRLASEVVNTVRPTITGADNVSIDFGSNFDDMSGVTAKDEQGNDITNLITVDGTVNTSKSGNYTLTYSVTDPTNSILVTTIDRIVTVKPDPTADNTAPVINGVSDKSVQWGTNFDSMAGVSATDDVDGDVDVTVSGSVNTKVAGSYKEGTGTNGFNDKVYTLTYTATDNAGNTATETRDITVKYFANHTNDNGEVYRNYYSGGTLMNRRYYYNNDYSGKQKQYIYYYSNGKVKQRNYYHSNGKHQQTNHYYSNGSLKDAYYYNTSGTKTRYRKTFSSSNDKTYLDYNYYSNGKVSKRQEYNSNGTRARITEYNSYGYYKLITTYNSKGYKTSHKEYVFGSQSKESSRQKTKDYTYYSNNNRIHTRTTWNSSGKKTTYYEKYNQSNGQYKRYYNYFSNGKVSKRQTWDSDGDKTDHQEYHSNGKVKTNYNYYSNGTIKTRYTYNSKGHRTTYYVRYQGTKSSSGHKSGSYKDYRTYYSNGKWKLRKLYASDGDYTDYKEYYSNGKTKTNYDYYSNGKVKAKYLYYSNGHYKQRRWYYSNGDLKEVRYYNSKGHRTSTKTYKQSSSSNTSSSSKTIGNMNTFETQVFNEINAWRKAHGYSTLKHSNQLHSYAEKEVKASSPSNPHPLVSDIDIRKSWNDWNWIQAYCGNKSVTSCSAKSYVNSWANSSGHKKIMSGNWDYMSVAYDGNDIQVVFTKDAK